MTTLPELLEALESATEPSRELDDDLRKLFLPDFEKRCWCTGACMKLHGVCVAVPKYTSSLDAAVSLCEAALPAWTAWEIRSRANKTRFHAEVSRVVDGEEEYIAASHPNPALALCTAICRAVMATQENHNDKE